jgi:AraC-like DNA-binding protein
MIETPYETFLRSTPGRYAVTGSSFVWCASKKLCGAVMWGRQSEAETRRILHIFDQHETQMARSFSVVFDTRGVDHVEPQSLAVLVSWLSARRDSLRERITLQASVIRDGPIAFLLTGILPVVGRTHAYRLFTDPFEAFTAVTETDLGALCAEVEGITERLRGVPRELRALRALLAERIDVSFDEISRTLATSPRSLQRLLATHGTSFRDEVISARFALAQDALRSTDDKLAAVAARVGISERALTMMFKARTGMTPAEWRRSGG